MPTATMRDGCIDKREASGRLINVIDAVPVINGGRDGREGMARQTEISTPNRL